MEVRSLHANPGALSELSLIFIVIKVGMTVAVISGDAVGGAMKYLSRHEIYSSGAFVVQLGLVLLSLGYDEGPKQPIR